MKKWSSHISTIEGIPTWIWVRENHPQNGVFRVYWKEVYTPYSGSATFDPEEGNGLRYEWYYKDGKRADGISKGWFPNGKLRQTQTWKNGKLNGLYIGYFENGLKQSESMYIDNEEYGAWQEWYDNGQKCSEGYHIGWNNDIDKEKVRDGKWIFWYENGNKRMEGYYKGGIEIGEWTYWDETGNKIDRKKRK